MELLYPRCCGLDLQKKSITACVLLAEGKKRQKVLRRFGTVMAELTDRGTEYCGQREHHEYQLYLGVENFDHTKTKAKSPQTNGICERLHRTMQDEFYSVAFRKKLYTSLDELQADLDLWLQEYNQNRPHSGRYCHGKTPMQKFLDSKQMAHEKQLDRLVLVTSPDQLSRRAARAASTVS